MSFDELKSATAKKVEKVTIESGDKKFYFTANEITYIQRLHLASIQQAGGDALTQMIVYSIKDEQGRHMTLAQAEQLADEPAQAFFMAASKVNAGEEAEKN